VALEPAVGDLPAAVSRVLRELIDQATRILGTDLRSVILYGSAAEGRLRATSDVNLLLLLERFDDNHVSELGEPLRIARAAANVRPMLLLESELEPAAAAFAIKFTDIRRRRRVLSGDDPFDRLIIPRDAIKGRLLQVLLNLKLRMRERLVSQSAWDEQLARTLANGGRAASCERRGAARTRRSAGTIAATRPGAGGT
jgi:predicted nucleotidyltransferase